LRRSSGTTIELAEPHCDSGGAHGADLQQRPAWDLDPVDR
jgi:hypothetical protein